ncbi:carcinoembryonic antigen-related cell adhesion molecule 5-like isoform X2 [Mercenaria mercenaria]|uniref:carcinoembryonic antigen-related cell adhesion molecule 5-like isoform X2 n=1 Tax=Mercenaria mercenaria TaxID=6596 RepID=UPI00234E486D|nr:carcinoembryonic antigen-related cell adhesion molecule 5-like isoform X2 [Mercenaria mercenaria]
MFTGLKTPHNRNAKVTSSPSITSNGPVKEGTRIKLTCTAKCDNSTCEYTWTSELTSPNKTMILDIPVNRSYKNEEFKCTVRDTGDNDTKSVTKTFDVFYGPDKVTVAAGSSITVVEGELSDKRNLTCKALNCNPKCDFTWTRNEKNVSYTTALFPTNRQILRDNSSSYTCTASNVKTGSKASSSVQIKVQYAPDVTLSWKKNENTLICRATGVPNDYTFSKIQQKVEDVLVKRHDVTVSGDTATLNLKDKDYQDTGKYECFVDNGIIHYETKNKTRNKTTQIEVEDKPVLVSSKPSYNVSKGSSLNISLTLYSYPEAQAYIDHQWAPIKSVFAAPEVEVKFHEIPVKIGGQEIILNLNEVLEKHFTKHTVYIKNIVGNISTDVTIFPEGMYRSLKIFNRHVTFNFYKL